MRFDELAPSTVDRWGRAEWTVDMTVEHGESGQDSESWGTRAAALVRDAQQTLAEAEQLLAQVQQARTAPTASDLAARQAAIVDAAHEEAALILAKAHADAARILEQAALGRARGEAHAAAPAGGETGAFVDLRSADPPNDTIDSALVVDRVEADPPADPPTDSSAVDGPVAAAVLREPIDPVGADVRASIAAAAEVARRVSSRIERLSHDLHQAPAS